MTTTIDTAIIFILVILALAEMLTSHRRIIKRLSPLFGVIIFNIFLKLLIALVALNQSGIAYMGDILIATIMGDILIATIGMAIGFFYFFETSQFNWIDLITNSLNQYLKSQSKQKDNKMKTKVL